jgi:hypothetical protein
MDRPGNCTICGRSSHDPECPTCSSIYYVEEEEVNTKWCEMCQEERVPESEKYCHYCIEEHQKMHEIDHCNPECISCAKKRDEEDKDG